VRCVPANNHTVILYHCLRECQPRPNASGKVRAACPEETVGNSTAFQNREPGSKRISLAGSAEVEHPCADVQPFLRNSAVFVVSPSVETPIYYRGSLGDSAEIRLLA